MQYIYLINLLKNKIMNDNTLNTYAYTIFSNLFCKEAEKKTGDELMQIIKKTVAEVSRDSYNLGRNQVLNRFKIEIENLKSLGL